MSLRIKAVKPKFVNREHYDSENFPNIVGFCDIDINSYKVDRRFESYEYKLGDEKVYKLIKKKNRWEIKEYYEGKRKVWSFGKNLGMALFHALTLPLNEDTKRGNIIFPVKPEKKQDVLVLMYYFGGCPGSWVSDGLKAEFKGKFQIPPEVPVLSYPKIPSIYLPWLLGSLKQAGVYERELVYFWTNPRLNREGSEKP